jgi:hypothetical protein
MGTHGPLNGEPISPELVLVDPELAREAIAALPERPWEAFVPPPRTEPVAVVSGTRPEERSIRGSRRRHVGRALAVAAFVAVAAFLTVAAYLPARDAPTLIEPTTARRAAAEPTTGAPAPAPSREPTTTAPTGRTEAPTATIERATTASERPARPPATRTAPTPRAAPKAPVRSRPATPRAAASPPVRVRPSPSVRVRPGTYAGSLGLTLRVTDGGRTLTGSLPVPCTALRLALTARIAADGTVRGTAVGSGPDGRVTAELSGRFSARELLTAEARLSGRGCDTPSLDVVVRRIEP